MDEIETVVGNGDRNNFLRSSHGRRCKPSVEVVCEVVHDKGRGWMVQADHDVMFHLRSKFTRDHGQFTAVASASAEGKTAVRPDRNPCVSPAKIRVPSGRTIDPP